MHKGLALFCALLLTTLMLASGCGNLPNKASDQAAPQTNKENNALVWGRGADSVTLDPAIATDKESAKVTANIFDTLVEYEPGSTSVRGCLATDWTVSEDGLEWTFNLRQGVKFHDGADFNAAAAVANVQRWLNRDDQLNNGRCKYWSYMFNGYTPDSIVTKVEATGDYQIKFTLRAPYAPFVQNLAMPYFGIASPAALAKYGADFSRNPVGTGPFKFVNWSKDGQITLARNASYWGEKAKVEQLIFRSIPNASTRFLALQDGSIDIMDGANASDVAAAGANNKFQVLRRPAINVGYLAMNTEKTPFNDQQVRQAVNYAVNKQAIISRFFAGLAQPAKNPLPPAWWGYNEQVKDYPYDPAKAKALLTQAG
ncbi:MAG: ABC transporter substrate-binding protein, partial [Firmicutes bacterium]|nr:ABC transporter substrate-binding protein [Bacillota bacterium]